MLVIHQTENGDAAAAQKNGKAKAGLRAIAPDEPESSPYEQWHENRDAAHQGRGSGVGLASAIGIIDHAKSATDGTRKKADHDRDYRKQINQQHRRPCWHGRTPFLLQ